MQFFLVYEIDAADRGAAIIAISRALAGGTLQNRVAQPIYSLDEIAAAHEAVERGTIGNVVVRI
jgi:NADPH2:quinone reductase